MNSARILLTLSLLMCSLEARGAQQDPIPYDRTGSYASAADAIQAITTQRINDKKMFSCPVEGCSYVNQRKSVVANHLDSGKHFSTKVNCQWCGLAEICLSTWKGNHKDGKCQQRN